MQAAIFVHSFMTGRLWCHRSTCHVGGYVLPRLPTVPARFHIRDFSHDGRWARTSGPHDNNDDKFRDRNDIKDRLVELELLGPHSCI